MFIQYSSLKDESKLPIGAYYTEPRDLEKIHVLPGDTLKKFTQKVENSREEKNYPKLNDADLTFLIVLSLEKTTPNAKVSKYFDQKAILPQFSQVAQLAKTLTSQLGRNVVGYNQRQDRADKCMGCVLNQAPARNNIAQLANSAISKAIHAVSKDSESLLDLESSDKEKNLGACGMCGCNLTNKVKMQILSVLTSVRPDQIDTLFKVYGIDAFDMCWILNETLTETHLRKYIEDKLVHSNNSDALSKYLAKKQEEAVKPGDK